MPNHPSLTDFSLVCFCALPKELTACKAVLDELYTDLFPQPVGDDNVYVYGKIGKHNIVLTCLPTGKYGNESAAIAAQCFRRSFPHIEYGLMVGIGAGVPDEANDVRLGDVVVSKPSGTHGGIIQYDMGKTHPDGRFEMRGHVNSPPRRLLNAVSALQANDPVGSARLATHISDAFKKNASLSSSFQRPSDSTDILLEGDQRGAKQIQRPTRSSGPISLIHYGLVASGNQVMSAARVRDRLKADNSNIICFEMEAAGLLAVMPCLVIRGICDYADGRKNDLWHRFAALSAAAYMKDLLLVLPRAERNASSRHDPYKIEYLLENVRPAKAFIGRNDELSALESFFQPGISRPKRRRVFVVHGVGGIGKTQLSLHYARTYRDDYSGVFWMNGSTVTSLYQSFRGLLDLLIEKSAKVGINAKYDLKDAEIVQAVSRWLALQENSNWLMVFDNPDLDSVDVHGYDVETFFPSSDHGDILIATRLQPLSRIGRSLDLQPLRSCDSKQLLEDCSDQAFDDDHALKSLINKLQGLPLALTLAGTYIATTKCSISSYIDSYERFWADLMEDQDTDLPREYHDPLMATWNMSYNQVKRQSSVAARLLDLFSFFEGGDLHFGLVEPAKEQDAVHEVLKTNNWLLDVSKTELRFRKEIRVLLRYSLLTAADERYRVHPVVHEWTFQKLWSRDRTACNETLLLALDLVAKKVSKDKSEPGFMAIQFEYPAHVTQLCQRLDFYRENDGSEMHLCALPQIFTLGDFYIRVRFDIAANELFSRLTLTLTESLGKNHRMTLKAIVRQVWGCIDTGALQEAERWSKTIIERCEEDSSNPEIVPTWIEGINGLGEVYRRQARFDEAIDMFQTQIHMFEDALSTLSGSVRDEDQSKLSILILTPRLSLAQCYQAQGQLERAEQALQDIIAECEQVRRARPAESSNVVLVQVAAQARNTLNILRISQGKDIDLVAGLEQAMELAKLELGPELSQAIIDSTNRAMGEWPLPEAEDVD